MSVQCYLVNNQALTSFGDRFCYRLGNTNKTSHQTTWEPKRFGMDDQFALTFVCTSGHEAETGDLSPVPRTALLSGRPPTNCTDGGPGALHCLGPRGFHAFSTKTLIRLFSSCLKSVRSRRSVIQCVFCCGKKSHKGFLKFASVKADCLSFQRNKHNKKVKKRVISTKSTEI